VGQGFDDPAVAAGMNFMSEGRSFLTTHLFRHHDSVSIHKSQTTSSSTSI
jgi:hypothetical protein